MMISRRFVRSAMSSSVQRLLCEQLVPGQCRYCYKQHTHLHTSNLLKEEMMLDIPSTDVNKVLGRRGSVVKKLETESGASIRLDRRNTSGVRRCIITGSEESIRKARQMIDERINHTKIDDLPQAPESEKILTMQTGTRPKSDGSKRQAQKNTEVKRNETEMKPMLEDNSGVKVNSLLQALKNQPVMQGMKPPVKKDDRLKDHHIERQNMKEDKNVNDISSLKKKSTQPRFMKNNQPVLTFSVPDSFHTLMANESIQGLPAEMDVMFEFVRTGKSYQLSITGTKEKISECRKSLQKLCDETVQLTLHEDLQKKWFGTELRVLENMFDVTASIVSKDSMLITGKRENIEIAHRELLEFFETKRVTHSKELDGLARKVNKNALFKPAFLDLVFDEEVRKKNIEGKVELQMKNESEKTKWDMLKKKALEEKQSEAFPSDVPSVEKVKNTDKSQTAVPKDLNVKPRPPVVTIMGHVDHGKTTLLDALRKSNVVSQEFGGITQHIGAFQVQLKSGHTITFLDTPGHAAFSNMRSRGASVTDVVVLVVAAEDGIMNQTLESINHAKRANVPVVVAINKIDHPGADPEKVKYELSEHGLVAEELGGDVQIVPISALKRQNLEKLQESIIVQTEVLDLKASTSGNVEGSVIEAKVDTKRGRQVTTLVRSGTLKKGDYLIAGSSSTKVRMMFNDLGKAIHEARPGTPVVVTGWDSLPSAGECVQQVENEAEVKRTLAEKERRLKEELMVAAASDASAEERRNKLHEEYMYMRRMKTELHWKDRNALFRARKGDVIDEGTLKFPVILKADVDGSLEVLEETLNEFQSKHIELSIVSSGVGDINKGDLELAESSGARIYGFNVKQSDVIDKKYDVPVSLNNVIYALFDKLVEDIQSDMPIFEEKMETGRAKVLQIFEVGDKTHGPLKVAGCKCNGGTLKKDNLYRIVRNEQVIYEGKLLSMKIKTKEVGSVNEGSECGLGLEKCVDLQEHDEIICLTSEMKKMKLEWDHGLQHQH